MAPAIGFFQRANFPGKRTAGDDQNGGWHRLERSGALRQPALSDELRSGAGCFGGVAAIGICTNSLPKLFIERRAAYQDNVIIP